MSARRWTANKGVSDVNKCRGERMCESMDSRAFFRRPKKKMVRRDCSKVNSRMPTLIVGSIKAIPNDAGGCR